MVTASPGFGCSGEYEKFFWENTVVFKPSKKINKILCIRIILVFRKVTNMPRELTQSDTGILQTVKMAKGLYFATKLIMMKNLFALSVILLSALCINVQNGR